MFNLAIRRKWRADNPAVGVKRNFEDKRHRYLSPDEIARLVAALDGHPQRMSAAALRLLLLTGARRGEVLGATWDMFDLERGIWTKPSAHTKQRRLHRVPLSSPALELLRDLRKRANGPYVFPGSRGLPLREVKRTWASVCQTARLSDCRIHDLRHSFASILASSGASLPVIGRLLGHTQSATTDRYAHLFDEPLRIATEQVGLIVSPPTQIPPESVAHE
jgi:integrase